MIDYAYEVHNQKETLKEAFQSFEDAKEFANGILDSKPYIIQIELQIDDLGIPTPTGDDEIVWQVEEPQIVDPEDDDMFSLADLATEEEHPLDEGNGLRVKSHPDYVASLEGERMVGDVSQDALDAINDPETRLPKLAKTKLLLRKYFENGGTDSDLNRALDTGVPFETVLAGVGVSMDDVDEDELRAKYRELHQESDSLEEPEQYEDDDEEVIESFNNFNDYNIDKMVEDLQEQEDEVECKYCYDLFEKAECTKDPNGGYICPKCLANRSEKQEPVVESTGVRDVKVQSGDKIRIINMEGEPNYSGKEGVVKHIDSAGQIHGTWGGCAIIPEVDTFEIINN